MLQPLRTVSRQAFVAEARTWLRTPYVHQARLKGVGVDCIGLPIGVGRVLGLVPADWDITAYARQPDGHTLKSLCDLHMVRVLDLGELRLGDLAVQLLPRARAPQHFGIVADRVGGEGYTMIHAHGSEDGRGEVVEHGLTAAVLRRVVLAYRVPGVL